MTATYRAVMLTKAKPQHCEEAISRFESALRLNPESAEAHFGLANLLADIPDEFRMRFPATAI
jgi:hypothetical protein